ncbi:signal transduction histidine kinase [Labrys wisconsinensis]|uniref:histidine kinase n=1 Tax=Labrys wisconsinensis TaxID=425677 RepID=A0ABU0JAH8_9HYPH|nr:signal transduction histidine kinase [Labrys wisconsinensis]
MRLVIFQTAMLALLVLLVVATLWGTALIVDSYEDGTLDVLKDAVARDADGGLTLSPTTDLAQLRSKVPDLWFLMRDRQGHRLAEGQVPPDFAPIVDGLDHINQARLGWKIGGSYRPDGLVKWVDTAAGDVQILTGTQGQMSLRRLVMGVSAGSLIVILPIFVLMALATLVATPLVVRHALRGLGRAAAQAERIDIDQRGVQLPIEDVPTEIGPLVKAVNDALARLDRGYERHRRFLTDAAHELRTPIAILNTRIASLSPGSEKTRLLEDATRLSVLTGQLLDFQRLDQQVSRFSPVDLTALARRVIVDLAPLAFAAGYEMVFEADEGAIVVAGDQTSLERALANLVQNAIDHGGRCGTITVRIGRAGCVEVCDEGDGIPNEERDRIFEPFHRLNQDGRGAGLGLNLVHEIMRLHGGRIAATDGPSGGACLRMTFPVAPRVASAPSPALEKP